MILRVFDFDDTLVRTESKVGVTNVGRTRWITPGEFAVYKPRQGDTFDFSQFDKLVNPANIGRIVRIFQEAIADGVVGTKTVILTARGTTRPVDDWMTSMGMKSMPVKALGTGNPRAKADYIEKKIGEGFNDIRFYDDSPENVAAVKLLAKKYPNTKIKTYHIKGVR